MQMGAAAVVGRPRGFDPADVLDETVDAMWRDGITAVGIRDLERRTGVQRSSLYHLWGDREGLVRAAVDRYVALVRSELLAPLVHGEQGLDDVDAFLAGALRWMLDAANPAGCLVLNASTDAARALGPGVAAAYVAMLRDAVAAAIARAVELGEVDAERSSARGELLASALVGVIVADPHVSDEVTRQQVSAMHALVASWRRSGVAG